MCSSTAQSDQARGQRRTRDPQHAQFTHHVADEAHDLVFCHYHRRRNAQKGANFLKESV